MAGMSKLKDLIVDGVTVSIHVSDGGQFSCELDGEWVVRDTLKGLEDLIRDQLRSEGNRLAIEAAMLEVNPWSRRGEVEYTEIVITGQHASKNNILYKTTAGERGQSRDSRGSFSRRLTPAELKEIKQLVKEKRALVARLEKWQEDRQLDARRAIADARKVKAAAK